MSWYWPWNALGPICRSTWDGSGSLLNFVFSHVAAWPTYRSSITIVVRVILQRWGLLAVLDGTLRCISCGLLSFIWWRCLGRFSSAI